MKAYRSTAPSGKPEDEPAELEAFLRRELERNPRVNTYLAELETMTPEERQARLERVVQQPLGQALVGLLRDEEPALERLVDQCAPPGLDRDERQTWRVALFRLAVSPKSQAQPLERVLTRVHGRVRDRAKDLERADRSPRPVELPEPLPVAQAPAPLRDERLLARLCDPTLLTPGELRVLRARHALYGKYVEGEAPWDEVARVALLKSAASAQTTFNKAKAKLRARYGAMGP